MEGPPCVLQIRTVDGKGAYFELGSGSVRLKQGLHPAPDFTQTWRTSSDAVQVLTSGNETELLRAFEDGRCRMHGSFVVALRFNAAVKLSRSLPVRVGSELFRSPRNRPRGPTGPTGDVGARIHPGPGNGRRGDGSPPAARIHPGPGDGRRGDGSPPAARIPPGPGDDRRGTAVRHHDPAPLPIGTRVAVCPGYRTER
jgi:hypothetical protein